MATNSLPHARLHKTKMEVLCGSRQNGRYWCQGIIGTIHTWTPQLRQPYEVNTQKVRDLGYQLTEINRPARANREGRQYDRVPLAILPYLVFDRGFVRPRSCHGLWRWSKRAHYSASVRLPVRHQRYAGATLVERGANDNEMGPWGASLEHPLTPEQYPVHVQCPQCELEQNVQAVVARPNGDSVHLTVWGDGTNLPWHATWAVRQDSRSLWKQLCSVVALEAIGVELNPQDETSVPPRPSLLYGVAMDMAERLADSHPEKVPWWRRLAEWSQEPDVSDAACRRCLNELEGIYQPAMEGIAARVEQLRWFAKDFLEKKGGCAAEM